jgi:hypothetical protein
MLYAFTTAKFWFHIQQEDSLNTGCVFYEDVLPHTVSGNQSGTGVVLIPKIHASCPLLLLVQYQV